jgi:phage/plasmid-associated DNA primase
MQYSEFLKTLGYTSGVTGFRNQGGNLQPAQKWGDTSQLVDFDIMDINDSDFRGVSLTTAPEDYLVVDIDNHEEWQNQTDRVLRYLKDYGVQTTVFKTNHGLHLWFKRPEGTNPKVATGRTFRNGFTGDIFSGKHIIWYMKDGHEPELVYENGIGYPDEMLEPITDDSLGKKAQQLTSGRNEFITKNYMWKLNTRNTAVIRKSVLILNNYVLPEPISAIELDATCLRPESVDLVAKDMKITTDVDDLPLFDEKNRLIGGNVGQVLAHRMQLHPDVNTMAAPVGASTFTMPDENNIIQRVTFREIMNNYAYSVLGLTPNQLPAVSTKVEAGVMNYIVMNDVQPIELDKEFYPVFGNEIINLEDKTTREIGIMDGITSSANYPYDPDAYDPEIDKGLDIVAHGDKNTRHKLESLLAWAITPLRYERMIIIKGSQGTGKSTISKTLQSLFNDSQVSAIDLQMLSNNNYTAELEGKRLNVSEDMPEQRIKDGSVLKRMLTREYIMTEIKYQAPRKIKYQGKVIGTTNYQLDIASGFEGIDRRIIMYNFNDKIEAGSLDAYYNALETTKGKQYLLKLAVDNAKEVMELDSPYTDIKELEEKEDVKESNDPIYTFLKELKGTRLKSETPRVALEDVDSMDWQRYFNLTGDISMANAYNLMKDWYFTNGYSRTPTQPTLKNHTKQLGIFSDDYYTFDKMPVKSVRAIIQLSKLN